MNFRGAFLLVLLPLVAACGKYKLDAPAEIANYSTLRPSVASYADMRFDALALPTDMDFSIQRDDSSFEFGEGISYYKAFALPETGSGYEVTVKSYEMADRCYPCHGFVYFYQKLEFLDAARKPVDDIHQDGPDYLADSRGGLRRITATVPPTSNARYLIVYTTRDFIENGESHFVEGGSTMIMVSPGVFVPISAPGGDQKSPGSPVGYMSIEVKAVGE